MAHDAIIVGGGHNGLVAATLLARAGQRVLVLERRRVVGGAAVSESPFEGVDARLSRYAYLVSLLPTSLVRDLGLSLTLRTRRISSYSPLGDTGLLVGNDADGLTRASMSRLTGDEGAFGRWQRFHAALARAATRLAPTLTAPLRSRDGLREQLGDDRVWEALFERPLSEAIEHAFSDDLLRGIVLTDATIGTFAPAADPALRQNRCFLYHVIGDGSGLWKVPVGGMGAVTAALAAAAAGAGAELRTGAEVVSVTTDGRQAEVACADGSRHRGRNVLANVAPAVLEQLLADEPSTVEPSANADRRAEEPDPEGSQLKINLLMSRLPRLRDPRIAPEDAFAGTFHVNEGYGQLQRAYEEATNNRIPSVPPCELYCHTLTDPTILSERLRDAGAHTLTVFGLHMPARLFRADPDRAKRHAVENTIASINSVLAEPLEDCLYTTPGGEPCLEARTPVELERELGLPGGHIFHRDLRWPFAETPAEQGTWGVETAHPNVWLCGAGARRGGGVSGIPGHNAARAVLTATAPSPAGA
jgi:phytoene dehydrogenase-like protein